jgi:hypothetical protein
MEGRQRWSFTNAYKRQEVGLVASSGSLIGSVAKELGLCDSVPPPSQSSTCDRWRTGVKFCGKGYWA